MVRRQHLLTSVNSFLIKNRSSLFLKLLIDVYSYQIVEQFIHFVSGSNRKTQYTIKMTERLAEFKMSFITVAYLEFSNRAFWNFEIVVRSCLAILNMTSDANVSYLQLIMFRPFWREWDRNKSSLNMPLLTTTTTCTACVVVVRVICRRRSDDTVSTGQLFRVKTHVSARSVVVSTTLSGVSLLIFACRFPRWIALQAPLQKS